MTYEEKEENTECWAIRRVLVPKTNPCIQDTGSQTSFCPCRDFTPAIFLCLLYQQLVPLYLTIPFCIQT